MRLPTQTRMLPPPSNGRGAARMGAAMPVSPQFPCSYCDAGLAVCQAAGGGSTCQVAYALCRATCG